MYKCLSWYHDILTRLFGEASERTLERMSDPSTKMLVLCLPLPPSFDGNVC